MEEEKHVEKMLKIFKAFFEKSLLMDLGKEPTYDLQEEETEKLLEYIDTFWEGMQCIPFFCLRVMGAKTKKAASLQPFPLISQKSIHRHLYR